MLGKTHKIGGLAFGLIVLTTPFCLPKINMNPILGIIPFLAGNIVGAYWPDIDDIRSTIGRKLWFISWIYFLVQKIINFCIKKPKNEILKNIKRSVNHRGFAHWLSNYIIGLLILFIFCFLLNTNYSLTLENIKYVMNGELSREWFIKSLTFSIILNFIYGFFIGCISHLYFDLHNPTGLPVFAPFSFKRYSLADIKILGIRIFKNAKFVNIDTGSKEELKYRKKLKLFTFIYFFFFIYIYSIKYL